MQIYVVCRTWSFERLDFGHFQSFKPNLNYKIPISERSNEPNNQLIIQLSAFVEIRTFGFWTLTVHWNVENQMILSLDVSTKQDCFGKKIYKMI